MKLFNYFRSSCSWRVRIALHHKGLPFEYVAVSLLKGEQLSDEHKARNAAAAVPVLELDDGRRIAQSLAILEYLEERHPTPALLPADPYLRARARQLAELVNSGIQPFQNPATTKQLKALGGDDKPWLQHFLQGGLDAYDRLAAETAGKFSVGDQPTFADLCLIPQLFGARRFNVDVSRWPRLLEIEQRCVALEAFRKAGPDAQPDTPRD